MYSSHRDTFALIARLASTHMFRTMHMAHTCFQTSPQQQHEFRVRARLLMINNDAIAYKYVLPNQRDDGPSMKWDRYILDYKTTILQIFYVDGRPHGSYTLWYTSEQRKQRCHYIRGLKHGESVKWFTSGQIQHRDNFVRGTRHGLCQKWYMSGTPRRHGEYNRGNPIGAHTQWYLSGNIRKQTIYYDDVITT